MKPNKIQLDAINSNDKAFDGNFYYGVKSTKIFCVPSCKSRTPKEDNIIIAESFNTLLDLGYRPCKRCKPTHNKLPDDEWMELVMDYLNNNFTNKLTLEIIAENTHSSPYHLHRKFKEMYHKTIYKYILDSRMSKAIDLLVSTNLNIKDIGNKIGIENSSQFIRVFKKYTGSTPGMYRKENSLENH